MNTEKRSREFYVLAIFFTLFVLFLYGPLSAIV
ncbi:MAG: ABC transporter permease, partial [Allorhizobium sp.]